MHYQHQLKANTLFFSCFSWCRFSFVVMFFSWSFPCHFCLKLGSSIRLVLCHAQKLIASVRFTYFTDLSKWKHHIFQDNKKSTKDEKSAIKRRTVKQSFIHITWRKIIVMLQWLIKKKRVIQCQTACHYTAVQSKEYKCNTIKCQDVSHSCVCGNKHSSPETSSYFRTITDM